ncbi:MAG: hypothetical protein PHH11_02205 [Methylomonas sp.]|nr:hypothetical protein [Methylomonas sp.]
MTQVHEAKMAVETGVKMMETAMSKMGETISHPIVTGAVAGAVATARQSTLKKILTHPVILLGAGFALGYFVYQYRRDLQDKPHQEE